MTDAGSERRSYLFGSALSCRQVDHDVGVLLPNGERPKTLSVDVRTRVVRGRNSGATIEISPRPTPSATFSVSIKFAVTRVRRRCYRLLFTD